MPLQLRDYVENRTPVQATYDTFTSPLILRAARRYVEDVAARLRVDQGHRFLPVLGENFMIGPATVPELGSRSPDGLWPNSTLLVQMPHECRLRLGALPVLAHEIAHLSAHGHPELVTAIWKHRWSNGLFRELLGPLDLNPAPMGYDEEKEYERAERIGHAWVSEVLADFLATAVVGPSYVYAIARFAIGTLQEFAGVRRFSHTHPPFPARLRLCLALLNSLGRDSAFKSEYLQDADLALDSRLAGAIAEVVGYGGSSDEELDAIDNLLRVGRIVQSRPIEVVGALWKAVVRKTGYLHETAALLSVAAFPVGDVEGRLTGGCHPPVARREAPHNQ